VEFKYFHSVNNHRNVLALHALASTISGFGGKVPPPYSRLYMGGEYDLRGFDIYTISPIGFFPTIGTVCNRDNLGNQIMAVDANGNKTSTCGSSTRFPMNTIQFPGGDTELLANFEYRIPIAGPVEVEPFIDIGTAFILRPSQLKFTRNALSSLTEVFPNFPTPDHLQPISSTNFRPRSSVGLQIQVVLPIVNAPFRVFYGYNWLRVDATVTPPQDLPPATLFPNQATYNDALRNFAPFIFKDRKARLGFTVARQF
jgi:outer membrane protein insertion porin family